MNVLIQGCKRFNGVMNRRAFAVVASETEQALRESISNYSKQIIQPKVSQMDHEGKMDPQIVRSLFDHVC